MLVLTLLHYISLAEAQASQPHVTSVLCKLTFSQESRCRVTSNRWDFVWEIKYWGLRTLNIIILTYFLWNKWRRLTFDVFLSFLAWIHRFSRFFFYCYCLTPLTLFIILHKLVALHQLRTVSLGRLWLKDLFGLVNQRFILVCSFLPRSQLGGFSDTYQNITHTEFTFIFPRSANRNTATLLELVS